MRLPKLYTLRKKLIVSFLIVALIPLMLLAAIDKHATEQILTKNAQQSLFAIASQTAVSIDTFINVNLNDVRVAAILPGLSKYLSLPPASRTQSSEQKVAGDTLRSLSRRDTINIFSYALLDLTGRNVLDTYTPDIGKDESNRDYFQQPLKTELPYVSNLRISSRYTDLVNIYFSSLVRNSKGVAVGVLRVSYNATVLSQSIVRQTGLAGPQSFAILLADDAVKAGIAMLQTLATYNLTREERNYSPIYMGIGINTGSLMLGTVGGESRMDGTVISDAVNLASRLEGLTKNYGVPLLISHHTFSALTIPSDYDIRLIDKVKVKGKSELVTVYEVFDADPPEVREAKSIAKTTFESAWRLYDEERFSEAAQLFKDCVLRNPGDLVAAIYLDRCRQKL
jgi:class 3 adenylate cyclase